MMNDQIVEKIRLGEKTVKLRPLVSPRDISLVPCILQEFESEFKRKTRTFIIDLEKLLELPPSFIVLLFEMTARARRVGGDVKIINLTREARKNLYNFNPFDYLAEMSNEEDTHSAASQKENPSSRIEPDGSEKFITIPSTVETLYQATDFVLEVAEQMGFPEAELSKIKIAVYEACLNVIEHAYHSDPTRFIQLSVESKDKRLRIAVYDRGKGFQVKNDEFDVVDAAQKRRTGGMGLHIIRRSMDEVRYEMDLIEGNKLVMIKYAPEGEATK